MAALFDCKSYMLRRNMFSWTNAFYIENGEKQLIGYCDQKAFKLKEDIRIYTDESKSTEILTIKAENIQDFSACYVVSTPQDDRTRGVWKRKGWKSLFRDTWEYEPSIGQTMELKEDSWGLALLRRLGMWFIPQKFVLMRENEVIAEYRQHFNFLVFKLDVTLVGADAISDAPAITAGAVLLCTIEGRQN